MDKSTKESIEQAALVAHQIKSPLGTLQTLIRTLLGGFVGEFTPEQKRVLEAADRKVTDAMSTVKGLLALAEVTGARGERSKGEADLLAAVAEACERYRQDATEKQIELTCSTEGSEAWVEIAARPLQEALAALVDNALRYTPAGGRVAVSVTAPPGEGYAVVAVADSGIGIPEEERDRLFRPFYRASNAKKVLPSGTGLGLPFVLAVVQAGGGSIAVGRSSLGGAEFKIELPLRRAPSRHGRPREAAREPELRVLVIGGVAAGPKIAAKIMRLKPNAEVTVVERGRVLSYAGCGLPYYISGRVREQRELISTPEGVERSPEFFEKTKNVRIINRAEAVRIDRAGHRVLVADLIDGQQRWLRYDKLALATGARPIIPDIPGAHLANVFTLHGLEHAEGIRALLSQAQARDVVIVGGGLLGVEMTESFVVAGCRVTLVEKQPQLLPILDEEMAALVRRYLESKGVRVHLGTRVIGFEGDGKVRGVQTEQGLLPADMVIIGVGVYPNVRLALEAGLELGPTGALRVDEHLRTSDPDIYAAGDCVESVNLITGHPIWAPFGSTANKQGRVAAVNICGGDEVFPGVLGTAVCRLFELTVGRSGLTERQAREEGYAVATSVVPAEDRAHFMPSAAMIVLELVADLQTRKLLGIQAVGLGEAAKRVDVAVTAMTAGLTVDSLASLDLCYAPSYAEALDNIHTAANVLRNKLAGHMVGISAAEVRRRLAAGEPLLLLDVRSHAEVDELRIEGARHIPLAALRGRLADLPNDQEIIVFSHTSASAYEASLILRNDGYAQVKVLEGGLVMWTQGLAADSPDRRRRMIRG